MIIRKTEKYMVDGLGTVMVHTAISGSELVGQPLSIFRGSTEIGIPTPKSGAEVIRLPIEFEIPNVATIVDAFAKFEEAAITEFQRKIQDAGKR